MDMNTIADYYNCPSDVPLDPISPYLRKGKRAVKELTVAETRNELLRMQVKPFHCMPTPRHKEDEEGDDNKRTILHTQLGLITLSKWQANHHTELMYQSEKTKMEAVNKLIREKNQLIMEKNQIALERNQFEEDRNQLNVDKFTLERQLQQKMELLKDLVPTTDTQFLDKMDVERYLSGDNK